MFSQHEHSDDDDADDFPGSLDLFGEQEELDFEKFLTEEEDEEDPS